MYLLFAIITFFCFWIEIGLVVVNAENSNDNLCDWQSKTPPVYLNGNQGNSSSDNYWFKHLSDVDEESQKKHFVFSIKNRHSNNYLPVEWLRSDKSIQIAFDRVAPEGCIGNDFDTFLRYKEDSKGFIRYGPQKQYPKDAPLYIKVEPEESTGYGPKLKSRIVAELLSETEKIRYRLYLEFITEREGQSFMYTVINRGSKRGLFIIPTFSKAWDKISSIAKVQYYKNDWKKKDGRFEIDNDARPQQLIMNIEMEKPSEKKLLHQEKLMQIEVLSDQGKPIGIGQINVYLPVILR